MKKGILIGCVAAAAVCALILPKVFSKKPFAEAVADPIVEITNPERRDIRLTTGLVGSVEPEDMVYVYPKASGEVTEVYIKAGDSVEKGQLLCVIDTKQIETAKTSLDSASLALKQAQEELSRQTILYAGGGISQQAYQQYQDAVQSAQISYNNAKVNYDNQVSYSRITAPISGKVEVSNVEVFDQVSPSNQLCVISGEGAKVVSFSVTERIKNHLKEGDSIVVEKDGQPYEGTVYEVSSMADSSTGLFQIKARLDEIGVSGAERTIEGTAGKISEQDIEESAAGNIEGKGRTKENSEVSSLPTGSMVKLYVVSDSAEDVLTVPVDSVYYDGGLSYVYTYDAETSSLHKVQVETGLYDSEWIEIKAGIDEGDSVLTTWSSELYEGTVVRIKEQAEEQVHDTEAETVSEAETVTETTEETTVPQS